ncbi:hypothetical protein PG996_013285 [Apiospora saccharicola]|uniref:Uncharacterized protein n=1 Tax=Apiospora saccharicola TaxID=335842 RepID=A0ABR1U509_9PEZI
MAQDAATTASDNRWDIGMPFPRGGPLKKCFEENAEQVGAGRLANPAAIWLCRPPKGNPVAKAAVEDIVQRSAVKVGATHAWIRFPVHNYGYAYDKYGNRIPLFDDCGNFNGWKLVRKDNHITVSFGTSENHVVVHGHIYVDADAIGAPTGYMDPRDRKYICDGDERTFELWKQIEHHRSSEAADRQPQDFNDRPTWQEEFLMEHYCPCDHKIACRNGVWDDHYCPCPHIELLEVDHWCPNEPCPHRFDGFAKQVYMMRSRPTNSLPIHNASAVATPAGSTTPGHEVPPPAPPSPPPKRGSKRFRRWTKDTWATEILAMATSVACTVATCVILMTFNNNRVPDLPNAVNLNAIVSTLSIVSSSLMMYAVSAAIGQVKWNWFRAQRQPLHHLELLNEASRGPLGSLGILLAGTVRSLATLGALVTLLNLGVAPFVQQVIDLSSKPSAPSPAADARIPTMTLPSFYFNATSQAWREVSIASNGALWNDASVYKRQAQCPTGNCTWPLVETLEWCVKAEKVGDAKSLRLECPVLSNWENATFQSIETELGHEMSRSFTAPCNISLPKASKPFAYDRDRNSLQCLQLPLTTFNSTFEQETFMDVSGPLSSMVYAQFSIPDARNGSIVLESLEQALLTLCKKTYNVSMIQGNISIENLASDYGRFYQDERIAKELDNNDTWCWTPNSTHRLVSIEEFSRATIGNLSFLSDPSTMTFCTDSKWPLANQIDNLLTTRTDMVHEVRRNPIETPMKVGTSSFSLTTAQENMNRVRAQSLGKVMESMAAALNQIYITKSNESATGMIITYETVVVVRWAWLALPIVVQALGLTFLLSVIATSKKAPLWKGSLLAALYHGFEHVPIGDNTTTSSGMAEAAENTRAMLTRSSKTKTAMLEY